MVSRMIIWIGQDKAWLEDEGIDFDLEDEILECKKINSINEDDIVVKNKSKEFNDCLGLKGALIFVNGKMKSLIEKYITTKINFVPVKIEKRDYWFLNVLEFKDCFDSEKSDYTTFENGEPDEITNLVIDESKINEYDLFKLKEDPYQTFVSKAFKEKIIEENISGLKFMDNMDLTTA